MEHLEAFLQSASYFGVIKKLMALSSTDIAVLFLVSKPAFVLTAGLLVLNTRNKDRPPRRLTDDEPAGALPEQ